MFQWLLLKEHSLSDAESTVWKKSALRIILVSGLLLELGIRFSSAVDALKVGAYYILFVVAAFFVALAGAVYVSVRRPAIGSATLIVTIYAAAFCIVYFINDAEIARLGILFVYTAPLIGRFFLAHALRWCSWRSTSFLSRCWCAMKSCRLIPG